MFKGIIEQTGKIIRLTPAGTSIEFTVQPDTQKFLSKVKKGDSIAINGACMTVEKKAGKYFHFTTVKESLSKTNLGDLTAGSVVNLEKPMTLNSGIDGHLVQGHVDTTGKVISITNVKNSYELVISFPSKYKDEIIHIGSIAMDGISLTIADIIKENKSGIFIKIAIIPHTFKVTNVQFMKADDRVNLEFDLIGKYIKRILNN